MKNSDGCCDPMISMLQQWFGNDIPTMVDKLLQYADNLICSTKTTKSSSTPQYCALAVVNAFSQMNVDIGALNFGQIPNSQVCDALAGKAFVNTVGAKMRSPVVHACVGAAINNTTDLVVNSFTQIKGVAVDNKTRSQIALLSKGARGAVWDGSNGVGRPSGQFAWWRKRDCAVRRRGGGGRFQELATRNKSVKQEDIWVSSNQTTTSKHATLSTQTTIHAKQRDRNEPTAYFHVDHVVDVVHTVSGVNGN
ncbi:hypothetical protein FI667_g13137, partial [Globisporangium splendens]